jgi:molybdopterin-guanine dinucleotide biosynthesis protein MobB
VLDYPIPALGICAFSGTGKTTLLTAVLPILRSRGVSVAVIKHAHHTFEMDYPGKDSYELRKAGATQMLIASRQRIAMIREYEVEREEPVLPDALEMLNSQDVDLVLVEGFKREALPKIELYRPSLGKPLMCGRDHNVIAVASDGPLELPRPLPLLELNDPVQIADFIMDWAALKNAH